ncbi:uncharacterized protein [Haliotis cracherodii]|uniref:uncharacterized protein n=1 Tax=Haliotis cracherodii TaxID=6455 RepID=UPI0039E90699
MSHGVPHGRNFMLGAPTSRAPIPVLSSQLSQVLNQHYQSFCVFQHNAMVMSQLLHHRMGSSRRQSRSPDSSPRSLLPFPLFQPFTTSPQGDRRRSATYNDQDEQFPFFTRTQSDEGYSSSLTSDSKSRLSCGSPTSSERSKNIQVSPESTRSKPSPRPRSPESDAGSSDSFESAIQTPEVSSSGVTSVISLDEDSQKSVSTLLPSFCDEKSNHGLPDCDIEIKIEPEAISSSTTSTCDSPFSSVRTTAITNPSIEIDFAVNVKQEVDSPVKFMNTDRDVMWAVTPDVQPKPTFVPSPDKSSSDYSSDYNRFPIPMYCQSWNVYNPAPGTIPSIMPFTPLGSTGKTKKTKKHPTISRENIPMSVQTEAIDLSITKKRKANTPKKDSKQKRLKKDADKEGQTKQGHISIPIIAQKRIWKRDPKHSKVLQESPNHNACVQATTEKIPSRRPVEVKQTRVKSDKVKAFPCTRCDKTYSQRSSLHTHMRIHTGVRPYVCKDCDRSFTDCSTYIKHCRLHTGEKPYACGVCGRCFTQSGNMMRHQQKCKGSI